VIDGEHKFDILLVRCRQGVKFQQEPELVHTIFVLIGTLDERNFHLRTLANVAQIIQKPEFDKEWMAAKGEQALRDIVLLGQRRREGYSVLPQGASRCWVRELNLMRGGRLCVPHLSPCASHRKALLQPVRRSRQCRNRHLCTTCPSSKFGYGQRCSADL